MRPKGPLFVEWHYTTVSSHAHPPVHDFRPYLHQPADLEMCGLAGDSSRDDAKMLSRNVTQFVQLFQPVHSFHVVHLDARAVVGRAPQPTLS
jgi:hypothetical protein